MIRKRILPLLIICILSLVTNSGCFPFGSSQGIIRVIRVAAVAVPDLDVSMSQLENHPGAIPFNPYIIVEPIDTEHDLKINIDKLQIMEAGPDKAFGYGIVPGVGERGTQPAVYIYGNNLDYIDTVEGINLGEILQVVYGFETDGVCYPPEEVNLDSESIVLGAMEIQLIELGEGEVEVTDVCVSRCGVCPNEVNQGYEDFIFIYGTNLDDTTQLEVGGEGEECCLRMNRTSGDVKDLNVNVTGQNLDFINNIEQVSSKFPGDIFIVWDSDPTSLPEFVDVPILPLVHVDLPEPEYGVPESDVQSVPELVGNMHITKTEASKIFDASGLLNENVEIDTFSVDAFPSSVVDSGGDVGDNYWPIQINSEVAFGLTQPQIVELPYTFWLSLEPVPEYPPDYFETEPYDLKVIVIPAMGGQVQMSTAEGVKLHDDGPEGTWQSSMAYDWFIDQPQEVTLTAIPSEGYRFVAWETDDFYTEIEDPSSPILKLNITPPLKLSDMWMTTTVRAYFALLIEEPQDEAPLENPLSVSVNTVSETIEDESGCSSIVNINYQASDLTGGDRPVSYVQINVDEQELTSWSGTPTGHYQDNTAIESDCEETRVIELKATNSKGQTKTTTKEALIPPLNTHFGYGILDYPDGGECQMQLFIEYEANDLTTPNNPITNVVVKANGQVWDSSGPISTGHYEDSFMRLVGCGHTYNIEVIGTDADGNKYTYSETVEIPSPSPEPPDEPPPPQTTLYVAFAASAHCTSSGPECSCQLSISFDGNDLTVGTYPVTKVVLRVNGQVWHDSGSISQTTYHQTEQRTVNCGETFNIEVTVNNTIGQTVTSTGSITTPTP